MRVSYNSVHQFSMEELLLIHKVQYCWVEGRKKLGEGDWGIGSKLPKLMSDAGLKNIDIRNNDIVKFILPSYETPEQKDMSKKKLKDTARNHLTEKRSENQSRRRS